MLTPVQNLALPPLHNEVLEPLQQAGSGIDMAVSPLVLGVAMVVILIVSTLVFYGRLSRQARKHPELETLREIDADPALHSRLDNGKSL